MSGADDSVAEAQWRSEENSWLATWSDARSRRPWLSNSWPGSRRAGVDLRSTRLVPIQESTIAVLLIKLLLDLFCQKDWHDSFPSDFLYFRHAFFCFFFASMKSMCIQGSFSKIFRFDFFLAFVATWDWSSNAISSYWMRFSRVEWFCSPVRPISDTDLRYLSSSCLLSRVADFLQLVMCFVVHVFGTETVRRPISFLWLTDAPESNQRLFCACVNCRCGSWWWCTGRRKKSGRD